MRQSVSCLALAGLLAAWTAESAPRQSTPPAQGFPASSAPSTEALESYLSAVGKAKEAAQRAWEALRASTESPGANPESDFAKEWLSTASANGAGASPFYAGTEVLLRAWI